MPVRSIASAKKAPPRIRNRHDRQQRGDLDRHRLGHPPGGHPREHRHGRASGGRQRLDATAGRDEGLGQREGRDQRQQRAEQQRAGAEPPEGRHGIAGSGIRAGRRRGSLAFCGGHRRGRGTVGAVRQGLPGPPLSRAFGRRVAHGGASTRRIRRRPKAGERAELRAPRTRPAVA